MEYKVGVEGELWELGIGELANKNKRGVLAEVRGLSPWPFPYPSFPSPSDILTNELSKL